MTYLGERGWKQLLECPMATFSTRGREIGEDERWKGQQAGDVTRVDGALPYHISLNPENRDCRFLGWLGESGRGRDWWEAPAYGSIVASGRTILFSDLPELFPAFPHLQKPLLVRGASREVRALQGVRLKVVELFDAGFWR